MACAESHESSNLNALDNGQNEENNKGYMNLTGVCIACIERLFANPFAKVSVIAVQCMQ